MKNSARGEHVEPCALRVLRQAQDRLSAVKSLLSVCLSLLTAYCSLFTVHCPLALPNLDMPVDLTLRLEG